MTVLNRPLFRQAGGPAEMMPQDLGPEAAMLQQAEQQAAAQAEQIGAQYAQNMMASLDSAESPEDLINALRGNQKPLDARYAELAQFVGEEDARNTPESVLAFAQPVIMMTEQGAMDSGIGELMQGLIGDVDMAMGMDEGVGSLMMAGAQEVPVPQNFNQGGAVQKFQFGGSALKPIGFDPMLDDLNLDSITPMPRMSAPEPRPTVPDDETPSEALMRLFEQSQDRSKFGQGVKGYYNELLPMYQDILGASEDQKNYNKAQAFFDIAQAGLALASGTDPRTGENMAGKPFGAQLAQAASTLPAAFQARAAEQRKMDQTLKTAALSAAMEKQQLDQKYLYDILTEKMKAAAKGSSEKADERVVRDLEGNIVAVLNLTNPADVATYNDYKLNPSQYTFGKLGTEGIKPITSWSIQDPEGNTTLVESPDGGRSYYDENRKAVLMPLGKPGYSVVEVSDENATTEQKKNSITQRYQRVFKEMQKGKTPRSSMSLADQTVATSLKGKALAIEETTDQSIDVEAGLQALRDVNQLSAAEATLKGTGPEAGLTAFVDKYFGWLGGDLDPEDAEILGSKQLMTAIRFVGKAALINNPRNPVAELTLSAEMFPDPDVFFSNPQSELLKLSKIKKVAEVIQQATVRDLASGTLDLAQIREAETNLREIDLLLTLVGDVPDFGGKGDKGRFDLSSQRVYKPGTSGIN